jgi:hypothetical protein
MNLATLGYPWPSWDRIAEQTTFSVGQVSRSEELDSRKKQRRARQQKEGV